MRLPVGTVRTVLVRHYAVHALSCGERGGGRAFASLQGGTFTYEIPAGNHLLFIHTSDFGQRGCGSGIAFVARPLGGNRFRISLCPFFPSESGRLYAGTSC